VLLDELGSGTDPTEGAALAQAVVNFLRDKGATTFVATHFPELKVYASQTPGVTNASLLFDMETLSPTYEMTIGLPGRSNAFAIARRLGLDGTILDDAMRQVSADSHQAEDLLDSIYTLREKMESEEAQTRLALRQVEGERDRLRQRVEEIEVDRQRILAETRQEMTRQIELLQAEIRQTRSKLRDAASLNSVKRLSKQVAELDVAGRRRWPGAASAGTTKGKRLSLQVGDTVRCVRSTSVGSRFLAKNEVMVAVGQLLMRAGYDDLEFKGRPAEARRRRISLHPSPGMSWTSAACALKTASSGSSATSTRLLARLPLCASFTARGQAACADRARGANPNRQSGAWEEGKDGEGGPG
jgi:DNA mismatch repair protein MutS2